MKIRILDIQYLDSKEIEESLEGKRKDYNDLISERKKGCISVMIGNDRYEIAGKENLAEIMRHIKLPEEKKANFVTGSIAFPGKVIGVCKVLHRLADMKKVNVGDVIVISMTDPNYVPVMQKASAFVTDFGGILCHAAIVSREMKKPCVIGTKTATKVFKDGDKLEVNANHGIVRKIE